MQTLTEFTRELAVFLTMETGQLYQADITEKSWVQTIHGPNDSYLVSYNANDRAEISSTVPDELRQHRNYHLSACATFNPARPMVQIAREALRKLQAAAVKQRETAQADKDAHDAAAAKTAAAVEVLVQWMKPYPHGNTDRRAALYSKQARVEINDGTIYEMKISALTPEQAANILRMIEGA